MLDSFRSLDARIFSGLGRRVDWVFLEVHAEGETYRGGKPPTAAERPWVTWGAHRLPP